VIRNLNPQSNPAPIFVVDLPLALGAMGLALLVSLVADSYLRAARCACPL
jgi:hypothetical protein